MYSKKLFLLLIIVSFNYVIYGQKKKAFLIGIDGLQYEQITLNKTPNLDKFNIKKGYTGGIYGTPSEQSTVSSPGWMSILTGVWYDQHNIKINTKEKLCKAPSIFKFIREHNKDYYTISVSTWKGLNLLLKQDMYQVNFATIGGNDILSSKLTIDQITEYGPDFGFIQLDEIDHIGHVNGFGKQYSEKIEETDSIIGNILIAIKKRENKYNEDWLIMIVTDHGRDDKGRAHGKQEINQKTIFVGMNKEGNDLFENSSNQKTIKSYKDLETLIPQTSIVPTILKHLDIPVKEEWKLDAKPLINE